MSKHCLGSVWTETMFLAFDSFKNKWKVLNTHEIHENRLADLSATLATSSNCWNSAFILVDLSSSGDSLDSVWFGLGRWYWVSLAEVYYMNSELKSIAFTKQLA